MLEETEETVSLPCTARTKGTTARRVLGCIVAIRVLLFYESIEREQEDGLNDIVEEDERSF